MDFRVRSFAGWMAGAILLVLTLALAGCHQGQDNFPVEGERPGNLPNVPQALTIPASTANPSVTLALLGDIMLGRDVHPTAETFAYLQTYLSSADLALANLESPLTSAPVETRSPYALCAPPGNAQFLADAGFDLLSISNNHNLDCGTDGLAETQSTLTERGLGFIGPDPEPVYRSVHGIPLAFLAFDATSDGFNIEPAVQAVRSAREKGALVLVSIHWGMEYQAGASRGQKDIAWQLADAGATLVWGHHPHVLQPSAWVGEKRTLVLYSLGNALFDQYGLESTHQSALILVTLDLDGVAEFKAIPFLIDVQNSRVVEAGNTDMQRMMQYFK